MFWNKTKKLQKQVDQLQSELKSFNWSLNTSLAGVVGTQHHVIGTGNNVDYLSHFAVSRAVDLKAGLLSQTPVKVFRGDTEVEDGRIKYGNSIFDIRYPHSELSMVELLKIAMTYYYYVGEIFLLVDPDKPLSIEPLNPNQMNNRSGKWAYGRTSIDNDNLIYIKRFNPDDYGTDARGQGVLSIIKDEIANDMHALKYASEWFKNFAAIGGYLSQEKDARIHEKVFEKMVHDWNNKPTGKIAGLAGNVKYHETQHSMNDASLLPLRKDATERILGSLGVNKSILGLDQVNRSVTEEATRMLYVHNIIPDSRLVQEKLNHMLMAKWFPGYELKFDYSDIQELQDNKESLLAQAEKMQRLGYTLNEVNAHLALGMDDVTDPVGDTRFISNSMYPFEDIGVDDETPDNPDDDEKSIDILNSLVEVKAKRNNRKVIGKYNVLHRKSSKKIAKKISGHFSKQLGGVMKIVYGKKSADIDLQAILKEVHKYLEKDKPVLAKRMEGTYEDISKLSDSFALDMVGLSENPIVHDSVVKKLVNRIKGINDTTYKRVKNSLTSVLEDGGTVNDMADSIRNIFKNNASRRITIARTESAAIINQSTNIRYKKSGVEKKEWISAADQEVRDSHSRNASAGAIPYDKLFPNGQHFPNDGRGGASSNIACRCVLVPVV